jgi:hypothetical protein
VISVKHPTSTTVTASSSKAPTTATSEGHLDNIYDSDFSQATLSPTSFHAGSVLPYAAPVDSPPPPDPALYTLIPPEMLIAPTLPVDMIWHCPVGGGSCLYLIDLCAPTGNNLRLIQALVPHEDIINFLSKDWKCNDEQVMMIFYEMVNAHWGDHLKELDIRYVRQGDAVSHQPFKLPDALLADSYRVPLNGSTPKYTSRGPQRSGRP